MVVPLHMGWRHVLFANWPVAPDVVAPHLPDGLAVDTYDGDAYLSVVPFTNVDVRPSVFPHGTGIRLPELNLRTYVTLADDGETDGDAGGLRHGDGDDGVYFFSLDADGLLGVLAARVLHHLPYYYADVTLQASEDTVRFESRRRHPGARPARVSVTYETDGAHLAADADSLAAFLTERYRYYTESPAGTLRYARIDHEPWPLRESSVAFAENRLFRANGFAPPTGDPVHYYSPGVDTHASRSHRV